MIKNQTMIVVGAGASKDLNMPLGPELQGQIAELFRSSSFGDAEGFGGCARILFGNDFARAERIFVDASRRVSAMIATQSVDNFLDQNKTNVDLVLVVKLAIAYCIALAESRSRIGVLNRSENLVLSNRDYFLFELLNIAAKGHQADNLAESLCNLHFVIFNYDRCLERYLESWLVLRFGEESRRLAKHVKITHVYGSIGNYLEGENRETFEIRGREPFGNILHNLPPLAEKIRIFTEQEDSAVAQEIQNGFQNAESVTFLGFGYESQNMRFFPETANKKTVFGTAFGLSEWNIAFLRQRFTKICASEKPFLIDGTSKKLFQELTFRLSDAYGQ